MPETITLSFNPELAVTLGLAFLGAFFLFRAIEGLSRRLAPGRPSLIDDLAAWGRLKLSRDSFWARSMETARNDGFDEDEDPFEFFAAGRDLVHDEACDLLGPDPDLTDLAVLCDYMRHAPEVLSLHVIPGDPGNLNLMESLASGANALAARAELPESFASLMVCTPGGDGDINDFGADFQADLCNRFGPVPDIPTLAGIALAIESHPAVAAVRITLKPRFPRAQKIVTDLAGRNPETGLPFISTAELSSEEVI